LSVIQLTIFLMPLVCCFISEFAENGTIYDLIHQKHEQPTQEQTLLWAKQVAKGR